MAEHNRESARLRRHHRVRKRISGTAERPRLCVYRSLAEIYVQLIDDQVGHTLVSASSIDRKIEKETTGMNKTDQARVVGVAIANRALERGIKEVVFDRGGYRYLGRVKALAEGARSAGLEF